MQMHTERLEKSPDKNNSSDYRYNMRIYTCTLCSHIAHAHVVYVCSLASLQSITGPEVACFLMLIYHCLSLDSKLSMYLIVMHNEYTCTRV